MAETGSNRPLRVIVGVAGGIAAYKAVALVREFVQRGADVTVIPTASALKFVGVPTWEAISRNPVAIDLFDGVAEVRHVALGQSADLVVVAPATAHTIAQMAAGLAGDLLGTTLLATRAPLVIAPAMHTEMWEHASVQHNVALLRSRGVHVVGPVSGELTGGDVGVGRMAEPADICQAALVLARPGPLTGRHFVISAGGTREALDPVRFIGNRSTGRMGVALANAALRRGATVTLVAAHLEVPAPAGVELVEAPTGAAMREALLRAQKGADVVLMAAAVADWIPQQVAAEKLSKQELGATWAPELAAGPDIVAELVSHKPSGQRIIGFSAETAGDPAQREDRARAKMAAKGLDGIILNRVGDGVGFGDVETAVTLFLNASPQSLSVEGTKDSIAEALLEALHDR